VNLNRSSTLIIDFIFSPHGLDWHRLEYVRAPGGSHTEASGDMRREVN